ncbi:reticulon-like protein B17 [Impatiens glandulifera]|uniref:reticulon-like protein B17 n=1 Tax=Impatiens glandulifera TaxID=253017 RepID=UPI001FB170F8|nr:reticulon-like protein B17 [Impatiens glandulifera]
MDSTPPSRRSNAKNRPKSASRLSRFSCFDAESEDSLRISLDLVPSSPKIEALTPSPSPSPRPSNSLPIHELLLLSPSPVKRSKTRLSDRLEIAEEVSGDHVGNRRRQKNKNGSITVPSPRNTRRSRRRLEPEAREERDLGVAEEMGRIRRRKNNGRSKKDKLSLVPSAPSPKTRDIIERHDLDRIGEMITDLIMWNDVAKSSLWFGLGSICFLSSCFSSGINFSIFSMISQLGLLFLGVSFLSSSICQRENAEKRPELKLGEEDILRMARLILPTINLALSKTRQLFSGEPTMTLKVAPFLVMGAEYGYLMTLKRLLAVGFFISFTGPKLFSRYQGQINDKVQLVKRRVLDAWTACSHKRIVGVSVVTAFWNLSTIKTRIFAAFILLVLVRYNRLHSEAEVKDVVAVKEQNIEHLGTLIVVD